VHGDGGGAGRLDLKRLVARGREKRQRKADTRGKGMTRQNYKRNGEKKNKGILERMLERINKARKRKKRGDIIPWI